MMKSIKELLNRLGSWGPSRAIAEHIRVKVLASFLALALIPLLILGLVAFNTASNSLNEQAFAQLEAIRTSKAITIERYFADRRADMGVLVEMVSTLRQEAFRKLAAIEERKAKEIENFFAGGLGDARFASNLVAVRGTTGVNEGLPVLARYKNDRSNPAYQEAFQRAESVLKPYAEENGYQDVMLLDTSGEIVFALDGISVGLDESENVDFQKGLEDVYIGDVAHVPGQQSIIMRIAAPVKNSGGRTIGVLYLEIDPLRINAIMNDRTGLGQTGETYLVGKVGGQNELRSNRVVKTGQIGDPKPGPDADKALAGLSGQEFKIGSTGVYELSAYRPLQIPNRNWAIIATVSVAELLAPAVEGAEQDVFANYIDRYGYYDLFLFEPNGYLFYTVLHEPDYQTNLLTGPYKDSNLGRMLAEILETKVFELTDFERYAPSQDAPAAFMAQPLLSAEGEVQLVVALQLPLDQISALMQERTGLGETGETYLVGQDQLWRTDSRFLDQLGVESTILDENVRVDTVAARSGLAGQTGTQLINDYRSIPVLSSWTPIIFEEATLEEGNIDNPEGLRWALIAEIDQAEVQQPVVNLAWITGGLVVSAVVLVVVIASLLSGALTRQVQAIANVFDNVARGDLVSRVQITSRDELGRMADGLNALLDQLLELIQGIELERATLQISIQKLLDEISGVAEGDLTVEAEVTAEATGAIADSFNFMIDQMRQIIGNIQEATGQVSTSAGEIRTTTETLSRGSESQAAQILDTSSAVEEMSISIQQVSENATVSATVAQQALTNARQGAQAVRDTVDGMDRIREQVQETAKRIKRLGESSQEIGEIVQLIREIAKRTMVLALNASLEAAAAGEAGRGFAVVAEDVKRLADRATNATHQITELIKMTQQETNAAVAAMEESTREVVEGSQLADQAGQALAEIESVSERLAGLIQAISEAATQQAHGSEAVAHSMSEIAEVTQQTAAGTQQAAVSISQLALLADNLRGSVSAFKLSNGNGHRGTVVSEQ